MTLLHHPARPVIFLTGLFAALACVPAQADSSDSLTAAIFVQNRAGEEFADKTGLLEDLVTARVTELGYSILSREILLDALAANEENDLDALLSSRTSAASLARTIDVDAILAVSVSSYGRNLRHYQGHGVEVVNTEHVLRASYRLFDAREGGSLLSDTTRVTHHQRDTASLNVQAGDLPHELLDRASAQLALALATRSVETPVTASAERPREVPFEVDITLRNLRIPDVRVDADGVVTLSNTEHEMAPRAVTVELDGIVAGSAPGSLQARPGLQRMRLSRDGFEDWERFVNIYEGFRLEVAMEPSAEGLARWREYTEFLNDLQTDARLTEAEIEVLRGRAEQLRQSGFRVDIQVDTEEGLTIQNRYPRIHPYSPR